MGTNPLAIPTPQKCFEIAASGTSQLSNCTSKCHQAISASPGATARSDRSCPAQNPRPAPVSSTARDAAARTVTHVMAVDPESASPHRTLAQVATVPPAVTRLDGEADVGPGQVDLVPDQDLWNLRRPDFAQHRVHFGYLL